MLSTQQIDPTRNGQGRRFLPFRWVLRAWYWLFPKTQADRDRQSDAARWFARIALVLFCVSMIAGAVIYAKPIKDAYDDWRAARLVRDAERHIKGGDPIKAYLAVQEAQQLSPDYIPALRILAQLLTGAGQNQAVYFWQRLELLGANTLEDDMGHVRALLRLSRVKEAENALTDLLDKHPANPLLIKLAEEVWGKSGADERYLSKMRGFIQENPGDRASALITARREMASESSDDRLMGRGSYFSLAEGKDETALTALRELSALEDLTPLERHEIVKLLEAHPDLEESDRVLAFDHRVRLDPLNRNRIIEAELARTRDFQRDERYPICRWLAVNGEFNRLVAVTNVEDIKTHELLLLNYMGALSMLGRLSELEALVDDPETHISVASRSFYKAHLALVKGVSGGMLDRDKMLALLTRARDAAFNERRADMLMRLAEYSESHGFPSIALDVYKTSALSIKQRVREAFAGWMRLALLQGDTQSYRQAAREGGRRWPDDQNFIDGVIYSDLLTGENVERQLSRAKKLLEVRPDDAARRLLVALGNWRMGNDGSVTESLKAISRAEDVGSPGRQAVYAALARQTGLAQDALSIDTTKTMLPEERDLWDRFR
jgi:hypothetical protein